MLHVTNGDKAVEVLRKARLPGAFLPWRDVLHEGPVDAALAPEALSALRARFIASCGWGVAAEVEAQFRERDAMLAHASGEDEVVLWFEHDLYDQLQLIQLLAWFAGHPHPRLTLVCEPEYLGTMTPARAAALFQARRPVRPEQLRTGLAAWQAFGSASPHKLLQVKAHSLRFLAAALRRLLQEFPWTGDGLSRLEREVLEALEFGPLGLDDLFRAVQSHEDPMYLGDTVLLWHLERMAREGLLLRIGEHWTASGKPRGRREARWIGGVRLDADTPWRWDPASGRLVALA